MTNRGVLTDGSTLKGAGFLVLAVLINSLQAVGIKWIGGNYSVLEIVAVRSLFALPVTLLLFRLEGRRGLPGTKQFKLEFTRGIILFFSYTTFMMGINALPLADVEAIRFSTPLMITVLSVALLGEKVAWRQWLALLTGLLGVVLIIEPGSMTFNLGSVFILLSVLFYGLMIIVTRKLHTTDSNATMAFYSSLVYLVPVGVISPITALVGEIPDAHASIAFLFHAWAVPSVADLAIMAGLGLIWTGWIYCLTRAYSAAPASVIAPLEYVSLPISIMWGFAIWHHIPTWNTLAGALLTMLSGYYILNRERNLPARKQLGTEE